jgi:hypothetical protein
VPVVGQSHIATNGAVHLSGTGSPEGAVTAAPGSTWLQTDATTDVKGLDQVGEGHRHRQYRVVRRGPGSGHGVAVILRVTHQRLRA